MSKVETYKCDECGKLIDRHPEHGNKDYVRPPYDWLHFSIRSNYEDELGKRINTSGDLCSTECARKVARRAIERLDAYDAWVPEELARQKRIREENLDRERRAVEAAQRRPPPPLPEKHDPGGRSGRERLE